MFILKNLNFLKKNSWKWGYENSTVAVHLNSCVWMDTLYDFWQFWNLLLFSFIIFNTSCLDIRIHMLNNVCVYMFVDLNGLTS